MSSAVLWIVPARSGSKAIPDKNIKPLGGIPLLGYRIKVALQIAPGDSIWCSTDSKHYAEIAISMGASVPFLRPAELASDNASSTDVILHAMQYAEDMGLSFGMVGLLEPTSPFVFKEDIISAVDQLQTNEMADAVVAVRESRPGSVFIQESGPFLDKVAINIARLSNIGRQHQSKEITPSGGFYISKWDAFRKNRGFYTVRTLAYEVPEQSALEIDEPIDWMWAEFLIEKGIVNINKLLNQL
jgi:CMP-N,N'-diacetyllegionaminic acid synthase